MTWVAGGERCPRVSLKRETQRTSPPGCGSFDMALATVKTQPLPDVAWKDCVRRAAIGTLVVLHGAGLVPMAQPESLWSGAVLTTLGFLVLLGVAPVVTSTATAVLYAGSLGAGAFLGLVDSQWATQEAILTESLIFLLLVALSLRLSASS